MFQLFSLFHPDELLCQNVDIKLSFLLWRVCVFSYPYLLKLKLFLCRPRRVAVVCILLSFLFILLSSFSGCTVKKELIVGPRRFDVDAYSLPWSFVSSFAGPTMPSQFQATLSWQRPEQPIYNSLVYYTVELRSVLENGQFGEWQVLESNLNRERTSYTVTLSSAAGFQYRITGWLDSGASEVIAAGSGTPSDGNQPTTMSPCELKKFIAFCPVVPPLQPHAYYHQFHLIFRAIRLCATLL